MKVAFRIIGVLVGATFIFAGLTKLIDFQPVQSFGIMEVAGAVANYKMLDPMEFARGIDNYKILPWPMSVALGLYLPWLEIICGLALIFRRCYSGALGLLLALMIVFIGVTIAAKARGIDITCGCFGHVSDQLSFVWHMVLDLALLLAVAGLWLATRQSRPEIAE